MSLEELRDKVKALPESPGVYQYLDSSGSIIYIGKAKNLRNRVSSYLNKNQNSKTLLLVRRVADLRYIVVGSEQDALLLENNLIKEHKPRYNILLKDDKSYPWIAIRKEPFPRVEITRRFSRGGAEYFGPFTSVRFANMLMKFIRGLYKLRTCSLPLSVKQIANGKFKECLEYHIHNCNAPCTGKISEEEYLSYIAQVREILHGNFSEAINYLTKREKILAAEMKFEEAQAVKESIASIREYRSKSTIVRTTISDTDVFSFIKGDKYYYVNYLGIVKGAVNRIHTIEMEPKIDEEEPALLSLAICEIRGMMNSNSKEIIVPFMPDVTLDGVLYTIPQIGDKRHLLELSERNAKQFKMDRERQRSARNESQERGELVRQMKEELHLPTPPYRMECFDNSNIQGTNPVASCVVFINGRPAKREYRKFHIKTVVGADDFASMEEVVYRRYHRLLEEGASLPDLVVIDGGKGQLHAALNSLEKLGLRGKIAVVGLAKRMEEIYFPGDEEPLILPKRSETLRVLMQIRDEAHRFGITFHRSLRSKSQINSELREIEGIGPNTEAALLQSFKSLSRIKEASLQALAACVGTKRALLLWHHFHPENYSFEER